MNDSLLYEPEIARLGDLQNSPVPAVLFRHEGNNTEIITISVGLRRFLSMTEVECCEQLLNAASPNIHPSDSRRVKKAITRFISDDCELNTFFRYRASESEEYRFIHACGSYHADDDGEKLYLVCLNPAPIDELCEFLAEDTGDDSEFARFIKGSKNGIPFRTSGYKGFSVWNLTKDTLVRDSGLGYARVELGDSFGYEDYYNFHLSWVKSPADRKYYAMLAPETLKENFAAGIVPPEHILSICSAKGRVTLRLTSSMMKSPESGDLYLRLEAENITESAVFETVISTSSESSDYMAYIDGAAQKAYFLDARRGISQKHQITTELYKLLPFLSSHLGASFAAVDEFISFFHERCGAELQTEIITKTSNGQIKSVKLKILDTGYNQFFLDGTDITKLMQSASGTYYDTLTGLPNMTLFRTVAEATLKNMRAEKKQPAFVYFDIRDMKAINEKYGFAKGDGILIGTSYVLREVFGGAPVARLAEDHFVVLTERVRLEQKLEAVHDKVYSNPSEIPVQICAGIYADEGKQIDIASACDRARLACKRLKAEYNRRYRFYDRDMFTEYHQRRHILNHFDEALEKGCIKVYYHPIVRAATGSLCDMEALSRWMDPEKGMLSPGQFISVLEDNKLITKLDFYMVRKICETLAIQKAKRLPLIPVSVNLSRQNFELCDVVEEVVNIVDEYNIPHNLLTIEITESAFIHNHRFLASQIDRFRQAGFGVWMDDFGSEYSSLNTLQEFTFDLIKLDMRFLSSFSSKGKSGSILPDIISMISKMGVHTLCEGVQTEEQLRFLRDIGCEKIQGYLFSKPMPCEYFQEDNPLYHKLGCDDLKTTAFYDKIGTVNLDAEILRRSDSMHHSLGGTPAAVIEYQGGSFRILRSNDAYKNLLLRSGVDSGYVNGDYGKKTANTSPCFAEAAKNCLLTSATASVSGVTETGGTAAVYLRHIAYDSKSDTGALLVIIDDFSV